MNINMKITRRHLGRIVREAIDQQAYSDPDFMDSAEYDRGYQDGFDRFPVADDATLDYDVGYEDGIQDADIPEHIVSTHPRIGESRHISLFKRMLFEQSKEISAEDLEKAADDLEKAFNDGPEGVRAFMDSQGNKDPAVNDVLVLAAEEHDGSDPDDKISVGGETSINVSGLAPTQQFIDLMQSVSFPLGAADQLNQYITTKTTGAPGAISVSGDAILDGHHRWSGVWAITPDGTVLAKDFQFPGSVKDKLAAAQLAVAAVNTSGTHPSKGGAAATDIIGKGKEAISKMIVANAGKQTDKNAPGALLNDAMIEEIANGAYPEIIKWAGLQGDEEFVPLSGTFIKDMSSDPIRAAIADTVAGNLASMPAPKAGAPDSREDMPQLDHPSIGKDAGLAKIASGLPSGEFNVQPPFHEGVMSDHDEMIIENWRRLAGINKL
jgi:hypothetical protein